MKTRKLLLIILVLSVAALLMKALPHKPKPVDQPAAVYGTGITKKEVKRAMSYKISDVKIPSGPVLKVEDGIQESIMQQNYKRFSLRAKAIYDASIAVPPAEEIEKEIVLRESRSKAYEETVVMRKREWITREMAGFKGPNARGDSQLAALTAFLEGKTPPPSSTEIKTEESSPRK